MIFKDTAKNYIGGRYIKPCPYCKVKPHIGVGLTWEYYVNCSNKNCKMSPTGKPMFAASPEEVNATINNCIDLWNASIYV